MFRIIHSKSLIARGIGYRLFEMKNPFLFKSATALKFAESLRPVYTAKIENENYYNLDKITSFEFSKKKYIIVRAGHTNDKCIPTEFYVGCTTKKKERKIALGSENKNLIMNLAKYIHNYRLPSAYTGRGIRTKHEKPLRKAGKKDKQKGRAF